MAWTRILVMCDLDLKNMILGQGYETPLRHGQ